MKILVLLSLLLIVLGVVCAIGTVLISTLGHRNINNPDGYRSMSPPIRPKSAVTKRIQSIKLEREE